MTLPSSPLFSLQVGTTGRADVAGTWTPRQLAEEARGRVGGGGLAVVFGPESSGLTSLELGLCHALVHVPTDPAQPSLNLAQAVMIVCYEIFLTTRETKTESLPRLANKLELEGMYDHLKGVLMKIGFIDPQNPEHWMLNIRRFLSRVPLRAREVRVIRGVCRQIDWYTEQLEKIRRERKRS